MKACSGKTSFLCNGKKLRIGQDKFMRIEDYNFANEEKMFINKKQKRQRQENSLDELTHAFIKYAKETSTPHININDIVKKLKVKKRRIYDITNVFEGKICSFKISRYRIY